MWASKTDYEKLYSPEYFGKKSDIASFNVNTFPKELADFCTANNFKSIIDVGSGSGILAHSMKQLNINVRCLDYEPATDDSMHFDLTNSTPEQEKFIEDTKGSSDYLVTCFDVLEHIDIEDVEVALCNLYKITKEYALFSISTRPSSKNNSFHSTILPLSTWCLLLEKSGFQVLTLDTFKFDKTVLSSDIMQGEGMQIIRHWLESDIFNDKKLGEPRYIFLKKLKQCQDGNELNNVTMRQILDIEYRDVKRKLLNNNLNKILGINLNFFQDYINFRPLLDLFKSKNIVILIRRHLSTESSIEFYSGIFSRFGIKTVFYEKVDEINWQEIGIDILLSAAESTLYYGHALASQTVNAAKLHGIDTYLFQHGIWLDTAKYPIVFESEKVLCWSNEQRSSLEIPHPNFAEGKCTIADIRSGQFLSLGAPKFFDAKQPCLKKILTYRLGIEQHLYDKTVLLATNMHWVLHTHSKDRVYENFHKIIEKNPNVFFIIKPHPAENISDYKVFKYNNSIVLDDLILGTIDFTIPRLIAGVDAVISSQSTLLLEAMIAGKNTIQYNTGNSHVYKFISPVALESLVNNLSDQLDSAIDRRDFVAHYGGDSYDTVYTDLSRILEKSAPYTPTVSDFSRASYFEIIETLWIEKIRQKLIFKIQSR